MKTSAILLVTLCFCNAFCSAQEKVIELPLTVHSGYGPFQPALGGISPYDDDENNIWRKTYLKLTGAPESWKDIKYGDIEINIYQSVYQNFYLGNISRERYEYLQKSWSWQPDSNELSKEPLKCKIAFAYGTDLDGTVKMVVDANNNLEFSDDQIFIPVTIPANQPVNIDTLVKGNTFEVSYETFTGNKITGSKTPVLIVYMNQFQMYMCNFPQYFTTRFKGEEIGVYSDMFTNLSFQNPKITLLSNPLNGMGKIDSDNLISKNDYIEIGGELFRNLGVSLNKNSLILEKTDTPKNQLVSTQVGFNSIPFKGVDFKTKAPVNSEDLKGKFVLLDFWAVWCGPCRAEIPNLKELYSSTDRSKFEIIGIVGDSPSDALDKLISDLSITWPQIMSDEINQIKEKYGVHSYPTTILLDPQGIIIATDLKGKMMEDKVKDLIQQR